MCWDRIMEFNATVNKICVGHHNTQTNRNKVNKTNPP